jgi:DNA-binding response OmpR family regulator
MPAPPNILIIDDSPLVLELTRSVLEAEGFCVTTAIDLDSFDAARRRTAPDLILVDVQMPEAFGDDVALTLRGAYGETAPIVLLSSLPDEELSRRATYASVNGWVSKRAGFGALVSKVREILAVEEGSQ